MPVINFNFRSRKNLLLLSLLVAGLFLLGMFTARHFARQAPHEEPITEKIGPDTLKVSNEGIKNLKIVKVDESDFPEQLSVMGRVGVTEDRVSVVPARIAGRIDGVFVASGETVAKEQLLANIWSPDFVVAREEYMQTIRQITSSPEDSDAQNLLALSRKKLESMGMNTQDINQLANSSGKVNSLPVRAPRNGVLLDKKAIVGNFVNQGDTLFTVGDLSKVWFSGDIYPEDLPKIHKGQEVVIEPVAGTGFVYGSVSFISPIVDPTSRTVKIRALMDNPENKLRGDMFVKGSLILSKRKALLAPKRAMVRLRDTLFCFKRVGPNTFQRVPVEVNGEQNEMVAVAKGLAVGDEVVSEGALLLDAALQVER